MSARLFSPLLLSTVLLLVALGPASAQDVRFFRITGPVPTAITAVVPDGTVTWTNELTNATFTVQTATLLGGGFNWVASHETGPFVAALVKARTGLANGGPSAL